jgi:glycosyltransferase involved in cell wall biosynthesis
MKVLLVNTTEKKGGAAIAVNRIYQGLKNQGVDAKLLVQYKESHDPNVLTNAIQHPTFLNKLQIGLKLYRDRLPLIFYPKRDKVVWSNNHIKYNLSKYINAQKPDIVQLCWVGAGFVPNSEIQKINAPIVWRLSDMWPFTGGCHYAQDCIKYKQSCGNCPQLHSNKEIDITRKVWLQKKESFSKKSITVVAISSWLAQKAKESSLFKDCQIEIIHNGVDIMHWKQDDKLNCRQKLGIAQNKKVILFGADNALKDTRKGFTELQQALHIFASKLSKTELQTYEVVIFGATKSDLKDVLIPFQATYLGKVSQELLPQLYSAADIMIVPSLEEAFGQTALEAIACQTPTIIFANTGLADIITHKQTGYVAKYKDATDLANGIHYILNLSKEEYETMQQNCLNRVKENFTQEKIAKQYKALYEHILKEKPTHNYNQR